MSPNLRWSTAVAALVTACVACVHVPESIKQEFRAAEPDERSNYQTGLHGTAPAAEASDPWSRHVAAQTTADAGPIADAAAPDPVPATPPAADASTGAPDAALLQDAR